MTTLYIDGSKGLSGNTLIGAFISLGLDLEILNQAVSSILNEDDYKLVLREQNSEGMRFVYFNTIAVSSENYYDKLSAIDVLAGIEESSLDGEIKKGTLRILHALFHSKAEAHKIALKQVDFHYEGMIDTIIDAIGFSLGCKYFNVQQVWVNTLNTGYGKISLPNKELNIPAPMTEILLHGYPTFQNNLSGELITPTGASIVNAFAAYSDNFPENVTVRRGYGLPKEDSDESSAISIAIGEA